MTKIITISMIAGILAGYFFLPNWFIKFCDPLLFGSLCVLLFFIGIDMGLEGNVGKNFKKAGWRMLVFPVGVIGGTFVGALIGALILPSLGIRDTLAISAGFGWYSLAPVMLAKYSIKISAISFLHNVMREIFGILLIPLVAKKVGYLETIGLPGAAGMDMCLPIIEKCTDSHIVLYSFISGAVVVFSIPVLVGVIAGI